MNKIARANLWVADVWKKAADGWKNRQQDYNYRKFLARPFLENALNFLDPVKGGYFVDLGCGDGSEARRIEKYLTGQGYGGKFFGFDFQQSLIEIAKKKNRKNKSIEMIFDSGKLNELIRKHELQEKGDLIFSTFLLQEISDAEEYFEFLAICLKKGGWGISLFLHPAFGTAMLEKGAARVQNDLGKSRQWRWAAEYPIVEESGKTFYVPYFHREINDYLKLARKYFFEVKVFECQPTKKVIQKCKREQLSPFYDHPGNVYYPEIIEMPSSMILMTRS